MRLRSLTPEALADAAARRARVREALASNPGGPNPGDVDRAPFLTAWHERPYPGTDRVCLAGDCYGHPLLDDTNIVTSPIAERGEGWARTASGTLYVLGPPSRDPRLIRRAEAAVAAAGLAIDLADAGYRP